MRILLALDGSKGATTALALAQALPWPVDSHIEAIRVVEPVASVFGTPGVVFEGPIDEVLDLPGARHALEADVARLRRDGLTVTARVLVGRPATVLVAHARETGAGLLVIGSRGRGPIASMVLGSVSAEVAVDAPCPVLVARTPIIQRVLVALDGTPEADRIIDEVAAAPYLRAAHIQVLSVAPSAIPGPGVLMGGGFGLPIAAYEDAVEAARADLELRAAAAADRLAAIGLDVSWSVSEGDAAVTIIDHAARGQSDLIVVGRHERSGMRRLMLGSVARNVLLHAHSSVLVLHEPRAMRVSEEHARQTAGVA
ncbi:MAG: universal stress protein [Candidatus Limnocylindrales bacterium]